ncbi:hypothetical protein AWJ14_16865 [Hoeflea olei]|uniref:PilZ domain-containing protein n=2 Tax=Hoeflea olei TaxID=1480615 RepID=A0A1C1YSV7_9HYPH|nr:hypothetical protein AWJ14_16865 [Hoeflea olei]
MYDEEPRFPFKATRNAGHIEYSRNALALIQQRCSLRNISRSGAIIEIYATLEPPAAISLEIPDSQAGKIGCVRWSGTSSIRMGKKIALRLRFLKLLSEEDVGRILANSTLVGEPRDFAFFV